MKYKYICKDCNHQFNLRSYNRSCEKCKSENISKHGGGKNKFVVIFILLLLAVVGFFLKDTIIPPPTEVKAKFIDIYHEVVDGNSVQFKLINTKYDTIDFDSEVHNFFNLQVSSVDESVIYSLNNNKVYPCKEGVKYKYSYDTTFMDGQKLLSQKHYVETEEFVEIIGEDTIKFIKSDKSICKEIFQIILVEDPNLDNDCRLFVYTNHPDNLIDSSQIDTIGYTYFTKGSNLIEISLTGKEGVYLKQNEFDWDSSITHMNVWARSSQYPDEYVSYINNGMKFEECFLPVSINEEDVVTNNDNSDNNSSENPPPPKFDWKKFKEEQTPIIKNAIKDPFLNDATINSYKAIWKLNGQDITENIVMFLDMEISNGKTLSITDIQVSRKGPKVNLITIKSR
jgi:hypothetical protein